MEIGLEESKESKSGHKKTNYKGVEEVRQKVMVA